MDQGRSPVAVALARQLMYRNATLDHPVDAHRVDSLAMFYTSIGDGAEGVAAFREKRDADFTARASTDMPRSTTTGSTARNRPPSVRIDTSATAIGG